MHPGDGQIGGKRIRYSVLDCLCCIYGDIAALQIVQLSLKSRSRCFKPYISVFVAIGTVLYTEHITSIPWLLCSGLGWKRHARVFPKGRGGNEGGSVHTEGLCSLLGDP